MATAANNGDPGKKKREISPEARQKLSELARQRHAEGKFGGAEFGRLGGRPRKDRAAKHVAEAAQEEETRRAIIQVFKDAVHASQPMGTRLKGAELWLNIEREEGKLALQEEAHEGAQKSREELISMLSEKLTSGAAAMILRKRIEEQTGEVIQDAEVVEEDDGDSATEAA